MSDEDFSEDEFDEDEDGEEEEKDPNEELRWEKKLLEKQLILYNPAAITKVKLENKVIQKSLQKLIIEFKFSFQNRFGPRNFQDSKIYLNVLKMTAPVVKEEEED